MDKSQMPLEAILQILQDSLVKKNRITDSD